MVSEIDPRKVKVHFSHIARIRQLYLEGFHEEEIAIAYKLPIWYIKGLTRLLKRPERI